MGQTTPKTGNLQQNKKKKKKKKKKSSLQYHIVLDVKMCTK